MFTSVAGAIVDGVDGVDAGNGGGGGGRGVGNLWSHSLGKAMKVKSPQINQ